MKNEIFEILCTAVIHAIDNLKPPFMCLNPVLQRASASEKTEGDCADTVSGAFKGESDGSGPDCQANEPKTQEDADI